MRTRIRCLLAASVLAVTAACGVGDQASAGTLTMTVWTSNEAQLALLDRLADDFAAEHDGADVRIQSVPQADYITKLSVRLAGGDPPDLGWLGAPDAVGMAASGQLADVGPALRADQGYRFDDFVPAAFTNWRDGEAVYGVPFSTSPFFVIYNKDLFAGASLPDPAELAARGQWTWERLAGLARELQPTLPGGGFVFQSNEGSVYGPLSVSWPTLDPLLRAHGAGFYDPASKECTLDSPGAERAIGELHRMAFVDGTAVPPGAQADFYAGNAALTITQLSRLSQLDGATFEWGVAPLPGGPGGQPHVTGQAGLVVFEQARNRELATEFLRFLTSERGVRELAQFYPPARRSVLADAEGISAGSALPPEAFETILVPSITEGHTFQYPRAWPEIKTTAQPLFDELWSPAADVPGVLRRLCDAVDPLLRQAG
ncbi:multiple sugar transport system substrate-binding protein [Amycolatopsis arida]|uniref:Multiple sugar transport system substrate-binding protein n=1 Tax=Amycolatopsis arida TaxID=587909 RepID=A0A1I5MF30_9PSEU|nr:extracellular solute-binding protein [Amycolatopsis arida]TDX94073.1 multiple sugar transport system substrate-binding protein [Amycolatopsis arida]SFP08192.1 multiple sugar transport system substrate-binding protein [Amycolatopsis arida]